jgi:hypothetical protein
VKAEPQKEHQWLQQLAGDWTSEAECVMGPGQPPTKTYGTERVRMLEGIWMVAEGQGEMPGGGMANMIMTLGYDPQKKTYLGTWIGSMMTHMWHYDGEMDASGRILTLSADGPSMAGDGTMAKYQDIIEIKSMDHRTLSSRVLGPDGNWNHFMTAHYKRKK